MAWFGNASGGNQNAGSLSDGSVIGAGALTSSGLGGSYWLSTGASASPRPVDWLSADDVSLDEDGRLLIRNEMYNVKLAVPPKLARRLMTLIQMAELAGMVPEEEVK